MRPTRKLGQNRHRAARCVAHESLNPGFSRSLVQSGDFRSVASHRLPHAIPFLETGTKVVLRSGGASSGPGEGRVGKWVEVEFGEPGL